MEAASKELRVWSDEVKAKRRIVKERKPVVRVVCESCGVIHNVSVPVFHDARLAARALEIVEKLAETFVGVHRGYPNESHVCRILSN